MNIKLNESDAAKAADISRDLVMAFERRMVALESNPSRACRRAGDPEFRNAFYKSMRDGVKSIEMAVKMASVLGMKIEVSAFLDLDNGRDTRMCESLLKCGNTIPAWRTICTWCDRCVDALIAGKGGTP